MWTPFGVRCRIMRVVRLMDEPDWQSRLSPIEEIFFATSPSAKTLRLDERQPFKERWLGRYIAYDIESFFVAITEVSTGSRISRGLSGQSGAQSALCR